LIYLRYCPACGEEYQPHMTECLDCGTALQDKQDGAAMPEPPAPAMDSMEQSSLPAGDYHVIATGLSAQQADALVQRFVSAGIPVKVDPAGYHLRLSARDEERAAAVALLESEGVLASVPDPSAPAVGAEGGPCPACGEPIRPGTLECGECGLQLGSAASCPSCGGEVSPDDSTCPACGGPLS